MLKILVLILVSFSVHVAASNALYEPQQTREISIIVSSEGYYPKAISIFEGEKIKFFVTATIEAPDCFMVQDHQVFLAANKGKITEGEAKFDKAGEYSFYCPSSKNAGKIVVIKKRSNLRERDVAGSKEVEVWTPKEYE
jgi:hypothetical protein